jgi:hypothetical protein
MLVIAFALALAALHSSGLQGAWPEVAGRKPPIAGRWSQLASRHGGNHEH